MIIGVAGGSDAPPPLPRLEYQADSFNLRFQILLLHAFCIKMHQNMRLPD